MRISDWSSDVCSSDLLSWVTGEGRAGSSPTANMGGGVDDRYGVRGKVFDAINKAEYLGSPALVANTPGDCAVDDGARSRSEEHTSELQSLMRISNAVFCLKKKKQTHKVNDIYNNSNATQRMM